MEGKMTVKMKASPQQNRKSATQKNKSGIEALLQAVRFAVDAFKALQGISARFDDSEKNGMRKLTKYAQMHAQKVVDGGKPDAEGLEKTTRLANNVARILETRFEAILRDSFILFDKGMESVRKNAPEILVRDGDKIVTLQDSLRQALANDDASYDDIIDAYKAMMAYMPSVSAEAEAVVEAARTRQRNERRAAIGRAVLDELEGLEID